METHYDAPEDDPFRGAMLEICELEVYGKLYFARKAAVFIKNHKITKFKKILLCLWNLILIRLHNH